jgi:hypothetical protein
VNDSGDAFASFLNQSQAGRSKLDFPRRGGVGNLIAQ